MNTILSTIPTSMATQHPDNADRYIAIQNEPDEAIHALQSQKEGGFGIEEIMIDFEGKLTPYHQTSQVAMGLIDHGIFPGRDVRLTPRIPNAKKEPIFRQLMSIMSLVETNILAYERMGQQAIVETVVPMVENGHELIQLQERINSVIELGNKNYDVQFSENSIRIIPLVETVPALVHVDQILELYYEDLKARGMDLSDIRVMLARSDSAMSYGMLASVLALSIAVDGMQKWSQKSGVKVWPILGCGALPFRGHLKEANLEQIMKNYSGVATFTIQSGLRYDHEEASAKRVVEALKNNPYRFESKNLHQEDLSIMFEFIGIGTKHYIHSFLKLIQTVERVAKFMPKNRDRLSAVKTGLAYIREIACMEEVAALVQDETLKQELLAIDTDVACTVPRAIAFTASMYTIGLPPEIVGMGSTLKEIKDKYGDYGIERLLYFYPLLKVDLTEALKYANPKVSKGLVDEATRQTYIKDMDLIGEVLGIYPDNEEVNEDVFYHTLLKSIRPILLHLLGKHDDLISDSEEEIRILNEWIIKMGKIRGSLG